MEGLLSLCCICMRNAETLSPLDSSDSDNVKYIKKLIFCVPNETWKAHYPICNFCISQLDVAYTFVQCCIESEQFRRSDLGGLADQENETRDVKVKQDFGNTWEEKFTCDHCGKSFRQKKYLSQHITKLHINKKQKVNDRKGDNILENAPEFAVNKQESFCNDVKPEIDKIIVKSDFPIVDEEQNKENTEQKDQIIKPDPSDIEDLGDSTDLGNDEVGPNSTSSEVEEEFGEEPKKRRKKSVKKELQKCSFCDEVFKKRQDWATHIRRQHTFEKPFSCDLCEARYMNRYSLLIHSRKHKNEKPFICATCGKSFVSSADLNHHAKIHNKDRAYPCPMCDRSFKTHSNLRTHRLQMHLDPAEWKFPCNLCEKKFPIRGNLMKHLKRHAGIKEFDCHVCEKKFVNKAELTLHLNTHTNQRLFKCNICSKDYKNREGLRRHMKVVHNLGNWKAPKAEKKYLCPMCPKIFAFGNKLQRHIFTHTGEKPFKCDYCQKRFIDKYGRKVHYKKDHNIDLFG